MALSLAASTLPEHHRPRVVHVVEEMPRTTWYRPRKDALREEGLPEPDARAWGWDTDAAAYVPWSEVAEDLQAG